MPSRPATPSPPRWWKATIALPTHGSAETPKHALQTFVAGDAKTGCVWLETGEGERQAVLWPDGHRAAFSPLRIYDSDGVVVWREGQERTVSGGPSTVHRERIRPACREDDLWKGLVWWLPLFRLPRK